MAASSFRFKPKREREPSKSFICPLSERLLYFVFRVAINEEKETN